MAAGRSPDIFGDVDARLGPLRLPERWLECVRRGDPSRDPGGLTMRLPEASGGLILTLSGLVDGRARTRPELRARLESETRADNLVHSLLRLKKRGHVEPVEILRRSSSPPAGFCSA